MLHAPAWEIAFEHLRSAGIPKSRIRSYALIGDNDSPLEAWYRCLWIEQHKVKPSPMWFHPKNALEKNVVSSTQESLGWDDYERRRIMQWFYWHKEAVS
jgi:hypothetical protein